LPEEYRVHGRDLVALSFFAVAPDHFEECNAAIFELFEQVAVDAPVDLNLLPFWEATQAQHPHLHRMEDILGGSYAVIFLTQEEFDGPLCQPPHIIGNPYLNRLPVPRWLEIGAAASYWENAYSSSLSIPIEEYHVYRMLGQLPDHDLLFNRALIWTARASDPNAGKAPKAEGAKEEDGYQSFFYWLNGQVSRENYCLHDWAKGHKDNHIGGTMRPIQNIPEFSPFYIGFEEYLGGYNFGGGNAQLDFRDMKFDWACG
jgi:hypothetical protein